MKVVVRHQLSHLLNGKILNYLLKHPCLHIFTHLRDSALGRTKSRKPTAPPVQFHTFRSCDLTGFKTTIILNHAIMKSDNDIFYNSSMSYSYCPSGLNQTIHVAWSPNHFPYSVTLGTSRSDDISLVYLSPVSETATHFNRCESLYTTFIVYFVFVHLAMYGIIDHPKDFCVKTAGFQFSGLPYSPIHTIIHTIFSKNFFVSECLTKIRRLFQISKFLINFF